MKMKLLIFSFLLIFFMAGSGAAATIVVTTTADSGAGSLRNAVASAANSGDVIEFNLSGCPCTITLTTGEIAINKSLTINGPGAENLTISGNDESRIFSVNGGTNVVEINSLTLANGNSVQEGGAIVNNSILRVNFSTIKDSFSAVSGGAIAAFGELSVTNSIISGNTSDGIGGGIYIRNSATNLVSITEVFNNSAALGGGAIYHEQGTVRINNDDIHDNNSSANGGAIVNLETMTMFSTNIQFNTAVNGGGIFNNNGNLSIELGFIRNNTASGNGGGIYNFRANNLVTASLTDGTIVNNNTAQNGGGVWNNGTFNLTNSTISTNTVTASGGGIFNTFTANLTGSTIDANSAVRGGGLYNDRGAIITNSTFSGNSSTGTTNGTDGGGAIHNALNFINTSTITLLNATIAENTSAVAGGGIKNNDRVNSKNTIFALNSAPGAPDFSGGITSDGFNLIQNTAGSSGFIASDLQNVNPNLGALTDNGGFTFTRALNSPSSAINAGTNTGAPIIDQTGRSRPMGGTIDIGATEFNNCGTSDVTNTNDNGIGSLRCAIIAATNTDFINFDIPPNSIINLTNVIMLDKPVVLDATGSNITISGSNLTTIFENLSTAQINGLTFANGNGGVTNPGGILNRGTLFLNNCTFTQNSGTDGGGLRNFGGTLEIINTTFFANTSNRGSAIYSDSTNTSDSVIRLTNSTISDNSTTSGGAIFVELNLPSPTNNNIIIYNTTIAGNSGSGISGNLFSQVTLKNTIVATNTGVNPDISGTIVSQGFNLIGNTSGASGFIATDILNVNPLLGNLADNGGVTRTRALLNGSPAIDKGGAADFPTPFSAFGKIPKSKKNTKQNSLLALIEEDQRGLPRPIDSLSIPNSVGGNGSDIGSFESQAPTAANVRVSGKILNSRGLGVSRAKITLTNSNGEIKTAYTNNFGYYHFEEIAVGETFIVQITSKYGRFTPQFMSFKDELTDLNFTLLE